jgi:hypothetical protein
MYDIISSRGLEIGTFDEYYSKIKDPIRALVLYEEVRSRGVDLGDRYEYYKNLGFTSKLFKNNELENSIYGPGVSPLETVMQLAKYFGSENLTASVQNLTDSLAAELVVLQLRRSEIEASPAGYERQLKTSQEIWGQVMWMALALLTVAYPLRFLVLGVRWSVKVLREG